MNFSITAWRASKSKRRSLWGQCFINASSIWSRISIIAEVLGQWWIWRGSRRKGAPRTGGCALGKWNVIVCAHMAHRGLRKNGCTMCRMRSRSMCVSVAAWSRRLMTRCISTIVRPVITGSISIMWSCLMRVNWCSKNWYRWILRHGLWPRYF